MVRVNFALLNRRAHKDMGSNFTKNYFLIFDKKLIYAVYLTIVTIKVILHFMKI